MPKPSLLIVDDEPNILSTLRRALELEGYAVEVAGSGRVALEKLKAGAFDGGLLDVAMGDMDGLGNPRAMHEHSKRKDGPFVKLNCAAIPAELIESELFGHEKGSFTGATQLRRGKFEQAHGGTLFLDEIGDMTPSAQAKVLRVLQENEIERVGGQETLVVDVRVVAATNKDLKQEIEKGRFRADLFDRLNVVAIEVPPVRERKEDVPALVEHFLKQASAANGRRG